MSLSILRKLSILLLLPVCMVLLAGCPSGEPQPGPAVEDVDDSSEEAAEPTTDDATVPEDQGESEAEGEPQEDATSEDEAEEPTEAVEPVSDEPAEDDSTDTSEPTVDFSQFESEADLAVEEPPATDVAITEPVETEPTETDPEPVEVEPISEPTEAEPTAAYADDAGFQPDLKIMLAQITYNLGRIQEAIATEDDYEDLSDRMKNDAGTIASLAIALGLSPVSQEEGNVCKPVAAEVAKASISLAKTTAYEESKQAYANLVKAFQGTYTETVPVEWQSAAIAESWLAHSAICNKLERAIKRFDSKADDIATMSTVLAVLSNVAQFDTTFPIDEEQRKVWADYSRAMREEMVAVAAAAKACEGEKVKQLVTDSKEKTCDACHEIFNPE